MAGRYLGASKTAPPKPLIGKPVPQNAPSHPLKVAKSLLRFAKQLRPQRAVGATAAGVAQAAPNGAGQQGAPVGAVSESESVAVHGESFLASEA